MVLSEPPLPAPAPIESTAAKYSAPTTFLRAPVAMDAVKDQTVIAQAQSAATAPTANGPAARATQAAVAAAPAQSAPSSSAQTDTQPTEAQAANPAAPASRPFSGSPAPGAAKAAPSPTPSPTPLPLTLLHEHVVQPGETLSSIGQRYGVSVSSLLANNLLIQDG